jgi:predicted secreted hydrolase
MGVLGWGAGAEIASGSGSSLVGGDIEPTLGVESGASGMEGFAVPQPGRVFQFPRDHGSHPEFRIEWWYLTGHLWDEGRRRYGFQATFFRTAAPRSVEAKGSIGFGLGQLHLAHMALLDVGTGRFLHEERLNREGWDAGASMTALGVTNGNWSLQGDPGEGTGMRLVGGIRAEVRWDLSLVPSKPLVVFGKDGVSRKGDDPSAASHYLTFPRLKVEGRLEYEGREQQVRGQAWMDHEFSSSQLTADQVGWDWASVQLNDGREVMAYRMRRRDGTTDRHSTLAWVDRDGTVTQWGPDRYRLEPIATWRSPRTGGEYPLGLILETEDPETGEAVVWRLEPLAVDQELSGAIGGVPYWEGACRVMDTSGRQVGEAFVELTGYAGDLAGRLR